MVMLACDNCCICFRQHTAAFDRKRLRQGPTAFKLVDEALNNRFLVKFKRWCDKNGKTIPDILLQDIAKISKMFSCSAAVTTELKESVIEGIDEVVFQDLQYLL